MAYRNVEMQADNTRLNEIFTNENHRFSSFYPTKITRYTVFIWLWPLNSFYNTQFLAHCELVYYNPSKSLQIVFQCYHFNTNIIVQ